MRDPPAAWREERSLEPAEPALPRLPRRHLRPVLGGAPPARGAPRGAAAREPLLLRGVDTPTAAAARALRARGPPVRARHGGDAAPCPAPRAAGARGGAEPGRALHLQVRGDASGRHSFPEHLLYLLFFPRVVAGPIVRARDLLERFSETPSLTADEGGRALYRI